MIEVRKGHTMTTTKTTNCFICGREAHEPTPLHVYWSVADAFREAADYDARSSVSPPSMTAVETHDPREAVYA